jgi:CHAT domain-containing protein
MGKMTIRSHTGFFSRLCLIVMFSCVPGIAWSDGHDNFEEETSSEESRSTLIKSMDGSAFVKPPKSIADIEELLYSQQINDPKKTEADRLLVKKNIPADGSKKEQLFFLIEKANALERLGSASGAIQPLKIADGLYDKDNFPGPDVLKPVLGVKYRYALALIERGSFKKGLNQIKSIHSFLERTYMPGIYLRLTANIAYLYMLAGRLEKAEKYAEDALDQYVGFSTTNFWSANTHIQHQTDCDIYRMQGNLNAFSGKYQEALKYLKWATERCKWALEFGGSTAGWTASASWEAVPFSYPLERPYRRVVDSYVDVLARAGRLLEAEGVIRTAIKGSLASTGPNSILTTNHLLSLSKVLLAQGRLKDAGTIAGKVIDFHRAAGFSDTNTNKLKAHVLRARAFAGQNLWHEAGAEFSFVYEAIGDQPSILMSSLKTSPAFGLVLSYSGNHVAAEKLLSELAVLNRDSLGEQSLKTGLSRGALGVALNRSGKGGEAFPLLESVLPILAKHSRKAALESTRDAEFNQWKKIIYEAYLDQLAKRFADTKDPLISAKAFQISQLSAGGSVQRAFAASSTRAAAGNKELSDLVRKYQDLVQHSKNLRGLLLSRINQAAGGGDEAALEKLRQQILDIKTAELSLADEIEDRFPEYSNLMNPKPVSLETVRASLKSDEALIVTHVGDDKSYVWAIPKSGEVAFGASGLGGKKLQKDVGSLRRSLNPSVETLDDIPAFNVRLASKVYRELLEPVSEGWKSAKNLLIIPDGPLGQLPFSVLVTEQADLEAQPETYFAGYKKVPFLVKSHSVAVVPSVSSLIALRKLPANSRERESFVGIGDPFFSKQQAAEAAEAAEERQKVKIADNKVTVRGLSIRLRAAPKLGSVSTAGLSLLPRLPDTADEVIGIARVTKADPENDIFLGRDASEGNVKELDLAKYKIIVFATHGLVAGDLDGLTEPALALTSPAVTGEEGDGLLTLGEILALKLDADWVVLSACNTASADGETSEAMSGLARAFFYAGARALLVSNWPVETVSAKKLTTDIFRRQADQPGLSRAQALRRSMLQLINGPGFPDQNGKTLFSYAHPIFWAPFTLVGDGRATAR